MKRSEYIIKRRTPKRKPSMLPGFIGFACVAVFSVYAFVFSDDAMASRTIAPVAAQISMPTAHELTVLERRLKKTTHNSPSAETCMRGQILGGTEIHFAMNFAPQGRPATRQNPGLARAHAEKASDTEKVLVLESKDPTVWEVTGKPSAIVLLGKAVISDYPEGTRVFAPRFASGCHGKKWVNLPSNWGYPSQKNVMESLVNDPGSRFAKRATTVSTRMFNRPYTSWRVQRGETMMMF